MKQLNEKLFNRTKLIKELKKESKNQLKGEATGTEIDLTDAFDTRPRYLGIDAKETKQETTTGKNLWNFTNRITIHHCTENVISNNEIEVFGTNNVSGQYVQYRVPCKADTTYTLSRKLEIKSGTSTGLVGMIYIKPNNTYLSNLPSTRDSRTFTTPANAEYLDIVFYPQDTGTPTGTIDVLFSEVQLEENASATDFEPYTGGQASPSPEFPQSVETMVGYRNLFDKNLFETFSQYDLKTIQLTLKPNTNYTMSTSYLRSSGNIGNMFFLNSTQSANTGTNDIYFEHSHTLTTNEDGIVKIQYRDYGNEYNDEANNYWYQLTEGTEEKPYVPYGSNYMVLDEVGKNLLQVNSATRTLSNYYYQDIATGILIEQNMVGKYLSFSFDINITSLTTTATYIRATLGYGTTASIMSTNIKQAEYPNVAVGKYFIKIEDCLITNDMVGKYLVLRFLGFRVQSSATYTYSNAQLEFNQTATSYEPYHHKQYPIPLANQELLNKNNYVDKIIVDESTGQSYIEKVWSKIVLDGSENWKSNWQHQEEYIQFYLSKTDFSDNYNVSTLDNTICTHLLPNATSIWNATRTCYAISDNITYSLQIKFDKNIISSLDNFILFLQTQYNNGTPVTIYYSLAEPQLIPIDNPNIKLLNGVNHITNSEGAEMDIVYVKDINMYLENELSDIKNAIIELGGEI